MSPTMEIHRECLRSRPVPLCAAHSLVSPPHRHASTFMESISKGDNLPFQSGITEAALGCLKLRTKYVPRNTSPLIAPPPRLGLNQAPPPHRFPPRCCVLCCRVRPGLEHGKCFCPPLGGRSKTNRRQSPVGGAKVACTAPLGGSRKPYTARVV